MKDKKTVIVISRQERQELLALLNGRLKLSTFVRLLIASYIARPRVLKIKLLQDKAEAQPFEQEKIGMAISQEELEQLKELSNNVGISMILLIRLLVIDAINNPQTLQKLLQQNNA